MLFPTFSVKEAFVEKKTVPRLPFTESAYPDACDILLVLDVCLGAEQPCDRLPDIRLSFYTDYQGQRSSDVTAISHMACPGWMVRQIRQWTPWIYPSPNGWAGQTPMARSFGMWCCQLQLQ